MSHIGNFRMSADNENLYYLLLSLYSGLKSDTEMTTDYYHHIFLITTAH